MLRKLYHQVHTHAPASFPTICLFLLELETAAVFLPHHTMALASPNPQTPSHEPQQIMGPCSVVHSKNGVWDCTITEPAENKADYGNEPGKYQPPDISPRTETVSKLARLLDYFYVVHVRGAPSSGKTTLAGLLLKYYLTLRE